MVTKANPYITRYAKKQRGAFGKLEAKPFGTPTATSAPIDPSTPSTPESSEYNPAVASGNIASRISTPDSTNDPGNKAAIIGGGSAGTGMAPAKAAPRMEATSTTGILGLNSRGGNYSLLDQIDQIGEDSLKAAQAKFAAHRARRSRSNWPSDPFAGIVQRQGVSAGGGGGFDLSGAPIDNEQRQNALKIMQIGKQRGMNDADIEIAIMTALTESGLRNVRHGDRDSLGLFQQRPSQGWGSPQQVLDPNYSINKYFDAYSLMARNRRDLSPWMKAQTVQRSFDPAGNNYRAQYNLARQIMAGRKPTAQQVKAVGGSNAAQGFIQQYNNKYLDFDGRYGAQCVDLFNYYNKGFVGGGFIGGVNGAKDIWSNRQMDQNYARLNRSVRPQMGDVAVWDGSQGGGWGHVAIVVGYNSNGTVRVLHSNATPAGPRGNSVISNMTTRGILGYFRPKKLLR